MSAADHTYDEAQSFERALHALRDEEGTVEQARALERRLLDALGSEALDAPLTTTVSAELSRLWWMVGMTVLIGAGLLLSRAHEAPLEETRNAPHVGVVAAQHGPVQSPAIVKPALLPPDAPPVIKPQTLQRLTRRSAQRAAAVAAPSPERMSTAAKPQVEGELSLLRRARVALRRDPVAALSLAEQHARDYPRGVFVQEREVLALEALLKQRRRAEAMKRAERFVTEQASSPYALRIREMLVNKPRGPAELDAPKTQESSP